MTKIVLIDDHKLFRDGMKRILDVEPSFSIIAEGDDGSVVPELIEKHAPDMVLMDSDMPHRNGLEATAAIMKRYSDMKVILFSTHDQESYVTHALKTGAQGYLLKDTDAESLLEAIKVVRDGGSYIHPTVTHHLVKEYRRLSHSPDINQPVKNHRPIHLLTRREWEVLEEMAKGNSNRAIGKSLFISEKTVKNHVTNILVKLDVNDRTQAVVKAIKNGWVKLEFEVS